MPFTDTRRVREDYWYTSAQVVDVGTAWAEANPERLFLYREVANRTALEVANAPELNSLPKKILLPLNKGNNHWTAVAITLDETEDHRVNIRISFTDSINTNTNLTHHDPCILKELARIEAVFRKKYGPERLNIVSSVYPHAWRQPDGSSCGPYSLANATRCLAGKGQEVNPGRKVIRGQQLNVMTHKTAIMGCSTDNAVDEILLDWILFQAEKGTSASVTTAAKVEEICAYYADKHKLDLFDVVGTIHAEYCSGTTKPWFRPHQVNTRVRELIGEYGIRLSSFPWAKTPSNLKVPVKHENSSGALAKMQTSPGKQTKVAKYQQDYSDLSNDKLIPIFNAYDNLQKKAASIGQENIAQKIDGLRQILAKSTNDEIFTLQLMEPITLAMQKANQDEAEKLVKDALGSEHQKGSREACFALISDIIGSRRFAQDNNEKFIYLASAYKSLGDAMDKVKQIELVNFDTPQHVLEAHLQLLQGAIERNSAPAIRQVSLAIRDFCSVIFEFITCGRWESDITRIERISQNFKDTQGQLNTQMLKQEQASIEVILTARTNLVNQYGEDAGFDKLTLI